MICDIGTICTVYDFNAVCNPLWCPLDRIIVMSDSLMFAQERFCGRESLLHKGFVPSRRLSKGKGVVGKAGPSFAF